MAKPKPKKRASKSKAKRKAAKKRTPTKRATKSKYEDRVKYGTYGGKTVKLTEREAKGGGIYSNYKKVRKVAKKVLDDPLKSLDRFGLSRRKFMKTRLGRRLLELSAKQLKKDYALLDDLIERFKETRS